MYLVERIEDDPSENLLWCFHDSNLELCDGTKVSSSTSEGEHNLFLFLRGMIVAAGMDAMAIS